jgi:uncharacterized membrane protein
MVIRCDNWTEESTRTSVGCFASKLICNPDDRISGVTLGHLRRATPAMNGTNPKSTASIAGHPIHPMLIPFPVVFLVTAFVTDLVFWWTGYAIWATTSMWLLGAGIIMALVAALFGFTDFVGDARIRDISDAWQHLIGNLVVVVLALINWFIRYKSGAAAGVFPWGIWISLITVLLLIFNGWKGWEMVYRHRVGVADTARE